MSKISPCWTEAEVQTLFFENFSLAKKCSGKAASDVWKAPEWPMRLEFLVTLRNLSKNRQRQGLSHNGGSKTFPITGTPLK